MPSRCLAHTRKALNQEGTKRKKTGAPTAQQEQTRDPRGARSTLEGRPSYAALCSCIASPPQRSRCGAARRRRRGLGPPANLPTGNCARDPEASGELAARLRCPLLRQAGSVVAIRASPPGPRLPKPRDLFYLRNLGASAASPA